MGASTPKQFLKVAGKMVIEHTVEVFEHHQHIDEIAIVVHPDYYSLIEEIVLRNHWKKVKKILKGGDERYLSSLSAIKAYEQLPSVNLIFHDAVRPLVSHRIIDDVIEALNNHNAVDVVVPATDTIVEVDEKGNFITHIPNRRMLRRGQTPQAFRLETIKKAYDIALSDPDFKSTDDCGAVVKYLPDEPIFVVEGEESNMKLTYKEDIFLLEKLFQLRSFPSSHKMDFKTLRDKVVVVFGGNSGIGLEVAHLCEANGAKVFSISRSTTSTDISDFSQVSSAMEKVVKTAGHVDYVVNSAALLFKEPLAAMDKDRIDAIISTNFTGMVNVALASYKFLKQTRGQLLLYTSSSYTLGRPFYSLYSSTKAAVVNFMQAVSQEWEADGIRVNVINPERTKTPMRTKNFGVEPDNTLLRAEEVAKASVETLIANVTGQVIDVKIHGQK